MELEETLYWLELLEQAGVVSASRLAMLTLIKMARSRARERQQNA
jgi:hypothetical protein